MPGQIAERLVHCRSAGRAPRALPLSELLIEFERDGADPRLLDSIARTVAWHGFYFGRHKGQPFAIFEPVAAPTPSAHLLILLRDGGVSGMLADAALETTIIDYDNSRARIGIELPEQIAARDFHGIRAAVIADFLADEPDGAPASAHPRKPQSAADGAELRPWC